MKNYDNVTARQLHDKKMEMMNDLGRTSGSCFHASCDECPISQKNNGKNTDCEELEAEHFDEYVKIIMEYEPKFKLTRIEYELLKAIKLLLGERYDTIIRNEYIHVRGESVGYYDLSIKMPSLERGKEYNIDELLKQYENNKTI